MVDVKTVKVGDRFVLRENDPERVAVTAKDKDGNSYQVSKSVPRTVETKVRVVDRIIETRDSGSIQEWFEVEYTCPSVDNRPASKKLYLISVKSPLWNKYEIE